MNAFNLIARLITPGWAASGWFPRNNFNSKSSDSHQVSILGLTCATVMQSQDTEAAAIGDYFEGIALPVYLICEESNRSGEIQDDDENGLTFFDII